METSLFISFLEKCIVKEAKVCIDIVTPIEPPVEGKTGGSTFSSPKTFSPTRWYCVKPDILLLMFDTALV
jgi:hypothetical protein